MQCADFISPGFVLYMFSWVFFFLVFVFQFFFFLIFCSNLLKNLYHKALGIYARVVMSDL